jgi:hypothetical protein
MQITLGYGVFLKVEPIPTTEAKPWILKKHYAKRMPCVQYAFGLFDNRVLRGVVTFGQPASPWLCLGVCGELYKDKVIELNRLCIDDGLKNGASCLIGRALHLLPSSIVVSYADTKQGHIGYVYQSTNWLYTGLTKERTDMYSESGHSRHHCGDTSRRQERSAKHRYVYFCGNRKERKAMLDALKYEVQPYPKGQTRRYDAGAKIDTQPLLFSA